MRRSLWREAIGEREQRMHRLGRAACRARAAAGASISSAPPPSSMGVDRTPRRADARGSGARARIARWRPTGSYGFIRAGRLRDRGQKGDLGPRQILHRLVEIAPRGVADAVDLVAVGHDPQVVAEDPVAPVAQGQRHRGRHLDRLAEVAATAPVERLHACHLHRQRRSARDPPIGRGVLAQGARHRDRIDAEVPAEAPVFDRHRRGGDPGRNLRQFPESQSIVPGSGEFAQELPMPVAHQKRRLGSAQGGSSNEIRDEQGVGGEGNDEADPDDAVGAPGAFPDFEELHCRIFLCDRHPTNLAAKLSRCSPFAGPRTPIDSPCSSTATIRRWVAGPWSRRCLRECSVSWWKWSGPRVAKACSPRRRSCRALRPRSSSPSAERTGCATDRHPRAIGRTPAPSFPDCRPDPFGSSRQPTPRWPGSACARSVPPRFCAPRRPRSRSR